MSTKVKTRKTKANLLKVGSKIEIPAQILKIISKTKLDSPNAGGDAFMLRVCGTSGDVRGLTWDMIAFGNAELPKVLHNPWIVRLWEYLFQKATAPR